MPMTRLNPPLESFGTAPLEGLRSRLTKSAYAVKVTLIRHSHSAPLKMPVYNLLRPSITINYK